MATRTLALLLAWVSSYGKKVVFTLGKNDVHIKCTENLKQCHVRVTLAKFIFN